MCAKIRRTYLNRFRFADNTFESISQVKFQLDTWLGAKPVLSNLDVVNADITGLLGMDIQDRESISRGTVTNRLSKRIAVNGSSEENLYIGEWYSPTLRLQNSSSIC